MGKLAIQGGTPSFDVAAATWPEWGDAETTAVTRVIESGKWWMYDYSGEQLSSAGDSAQISRVEAMERRFAAAHAARHALAVSSGSNALEVCVRALGIAPGDEVITTPYTFFATSSCVLNAGAWPVYVDIDPETYNIDPRRIEEAITERTRAIFPVHFGGEIADMDAINEIACRHELIVIEDAAQAQGVSLEGDRYAGTLGLGGTFSFQASKCLSCGEGGLITTNDDAFADACWSLRHCGRGREGLWYEHFRLGWNFRMPEVSAALLLAQLDRLDEQNQRRMRNVRHFLGLIESLDGLTAVKPHPRAKVRNHYLVMLRYDAEKWQGVSRDRFVEALVAEGVPALTGYTFPNFENPVFQTLNSPIDYAAAAVQCPTAIKACREEAIWLMHPLFLGDEAVAGAIADAIFKVRENIGELAGDR